MRSLDWLLGAITVMLISGIVILFNGPSIHYINKKIAIPSRAVAMAHTAPYINAVQLDCLARNIFWEARGESTMGKIMVGLVVIEREKSKYFPNSICGVVFQGVRNSHGKLVKNMCQFSWACNGSKHKIDYINPIQAKEWNISYDIAKLIMLHEIKVKYNINGMTHYHNNKVDPSWAHNRNYKLVARIGHHYFYRWKVAASNS